jgi:nicotinamidase-related amidase
MQRTVLGIAAAGFFLVGSGSVRADIIDEWAGVKAPPVPELKQVTVDPQTTALLMLDFVKASCGSRPRCVATLPAVKELLGNARRANVPVIFSFFGTNTGADMIDPDLAPKPGEPSVTSFADKFLNTNLEELLKQRGIKTVIAVGVAATGAILSTGSGAALRGYNVVVPVDGISDGDTYKEQYVTFQLPNGPTYGQKVTLTRVKMMKF